MSVVRLGSTALAFLGAAVVLLGLAGNPADCVRTLRLAPGLAAAGGAETVVLALTGLLAWATWAWGAIGLALTAAGGLPGIPGALVRAVSRVLVPRRLRAAAALALGTGLAVAGPVAAAPAAPSVPDWPAAGTGSPGPPDWPATPATPATRQSPGAPAVAADHHVVAPGDCLWDIAADSLARSGRAPTDGEVASAVTAWWITNAEVVGPDPDVLHPGQVLQAPPTDPDSPGGSR